MDAIVSSGRDEKTLERTRTFLSEQCQLHVLELALIEADDTEIHYVSQDGRLVCVMIATQFAGILAETQLDASAVHHHFSSLMASVPRLQGPEKVSIVV
jgi:pyruvate/2-oxoglutarate/acetoin dehydrogenase E1 component